MAIMRTVSANRFSSLKSITKTALNPKSSILSHNNASSSRMVPVTEDARKTISLKETLGIPVLDLSGADEDPTGNWFQRKGGKDIPVLETILEDEDTTGMLQFSAEDIKTEVEFWSNSVFCYIYGANPPWEIVEEFIYNVWDQFGVDRVSFLDNGTFIVRLNTMEGRDALLASGYYLFENKPLIIKPWKVDMDLVKQKVDTVPVWVRFYGIPLKFWGDCLPSITGLVGKFVKRDKATHDKVRLSFARVLVELQMDQKLPEYVKFLDENGGVVSVRVEFEWMPSSCTHYSGVGHDSTHCRKRSQPVAVKVMPPQEKQLPRKEWRPKPVQQLATGMVSPPILTPAAFPPLVSKKATPVTKPTPSKQIMRLTRQDGFVGVSLSGQFAEYSFLDALNSNTPQPTGVESGKDPPEMLPHA
ncbi:hypothetical protein vseg_007980 [Gypsophila vaccaria]